MVSWPGVFNQAQCIIILGFMQKILQVYDHHATIWEILAFVYLIGISSKTIPFIGVNFHWICLCANTSVIYISTGTNFGVR